MIALQAAASVVLLVWATPGCGGPRGPCTTWKGGRRSAASCAKWRPRPPCGDDPVLWHEVHYRRPSSTAAVVAEGLCSALAVGILAYLISWFAVPAFAELFRSGYGPSPGTPSLPDLTPFARMLVVKLSRTTFAVPPGQARLDFNIILRQTTAFLDILLVLMVAGTAAEAVAAERDRDTWLGLIATPLTGWEILRAKMIGAVWKTRGVWFVMLALWALGLLSGAVHPLGFLAALASTAVSCGFLSASGWRRRCGRGRATGPSAGPSSR